MDAKAAYIGGNTVCRQSDVQTEMNNLSQAIGHLEDLMGAYSERVVTITRPITPEPGQPNKEAPDEMRVPLADDIRRFRRRITNLECTLDSLINRCEL